MTTTDPTRRATSRAASSRSRSPAVAAPSKQESAYRLIRARIEQGEYVPGQRLVIDKLAQELGISQVPIREAIRRLEAESLLTYETNAGATIAPLSRELWGQLLETVALLEGYATALAAPRVSAADLAQLGAINRRMATALRSEDFAALSAGNRAFHGLLLARCPNRVVVEQLQQAQTRLDSLNRALFSREHGVLLRLAGGRAGQATLDDHARLIDAIRRGAGAALIERLTREHVLVLLRAARGRSGRVS